jgi:peroxiredoxin
MFDIAVWAGVAALLVMVLARSSSGPKEGSVAAPFELALASGQGTFKLEEYRGRPVLMEVFASWCGACERAAPMMHDIYRSAQQTDLVLVGVSIDQEAAAAASAQRSWPIAYPVAVDDGSVARAYSVSLLPTFVLIDRAGNISRVSAGVPSRRTLSRWLAEL